MEKSKKIIRNLILFISLIALTFYILLKDQSASEIFNVLINVKKEYIFIGIVFMCLYIILEAVNMRRTLKVLEEKPTFLESIKYVLIGFFFSSITPAASGGQPMQIYYMYKDKISVANSTLSLLINLCSFQIITISFGTISAFLNSEILINNNLIIFFIIGIALNSTALVLLLIAIFSNRLSAGLIRFAVKVLKFFKIKKADSIQEKLENEVKQYQGNATYIKKNKTVIIKTLITTLIQVLIFYSIPYWIYLSFGLEGHNIFQIITMQAVLYATVSGIPSPGAVGVSEGGFVAIFKSAFPATMINGAMILNRGVSFYLFVAISGITVITSTLKGKKK